MKYFLMFNSISSEDLGIKIVSRPQIPIPEREVELIKIEGRSGSLSEDLGTYKDITITVEFNFIDRKNINDKIRKIAYWINNVNDNKLFFSDDLEYFYNVLKVNSGDIVRELSIKGSFNLNFICSPFKYLNEENEESGIIIERPMNILSPSLSCDSQPILTIYGSGDITLTINGTDILLKSIDESIVINSEIQEAYSNTFENLNYKMYGRFPILKNGENIISWIGNVNKIEIIPNWRYL